MNQFSRQRLAQIPRHLRAKWPGNVLAYGFVPFPKRLLLCLPDLFPGSEGIQELRVVLAVVDYRRENLSRLPSLEFLSFTAGMNVQEFRLHLRSLEQRGLLISAGPEAEMHIGIDGLVRAIEENTPEVDSPPDFENPFDIFQRGPDEE